MYNEVKLEAGNRYNEYSINQVRLCIFKHVKCVLNWAQNVSHQAQKGLCDVCWLEGLLVRTRCGENT